MPTISPSVHSAAFTTVPNAPAEWSADIAPTLDAIATGFDHVSKARADIMADETKTEAARLIALNDLFQKHVGSKVPDAIKAIDALNDIPMALYDEVQAALAPSDKPHDIIVASEIRQAISRLSPAERSAALETAIQRGDRATMSAIVNAPAFLSGVSQEALSGYRDQFVAKHHPEIGVKMEAARVMLTRAKSTKAALASIRSAMFSKGDEATINAAVASALRAAQHMN